MDGVSGYSLLKGILDSSMSTALSVSGNPDSVVSVSKCQALPLRIETPLMVTACLLASFNLSGNSLRGFKHLQRGLGDLASWEFAERFFVVFPAQGALTDLPIAKGDV